MKLVQERVRQNLLTEVDKIVHTSIGKYISKLDVDIQKRIQFTMLNYTNRINSIDQQIVSLRDNITIARIHAKSALDQHSCEVASVSTQTDIITPPPTPTTTVAFTQTENPTVVETNSSFTQTDSFSAQSVDGKKKRKHTDGDISTIAKRTRSATNVYWIKVIDLIRLGYTNISVDHIINDLLFRVDGEGGEDGDEQVWGFGDFVMQKDHRMVTEWMHGDYWIRSDFVAPLWEILSQGTLEDYDNVKYLERLGIDKLKLQLE